MLGDSSQNPGEISVLEVTVVNDYALHQLIFRRGADVEILLYVLNQCINHLSIHEVALQIEYSSLDFGEQRKLDGPL